MSHLAANATQEAIQREGLPTAFAPAEAGGSPSLLQEKGTGQRSSAGEGREAQQLAEMLPLSRHCEHSGLKLPAQV